MLVAIKSGFWHNQPAWKCAVSKEYFFFFFDIQSKTVWVALEGVRDRCSSVCVPWLRLERHVIHLWNSSKMKSSSHAIVWISESVALVNMSFKLT